MLQSYDDILAIAREARRPIGWWDENGAPRFSPHHPRSCPDIYASEVVLLLISCQSCDEEFKVQMSWSLAGMIMQSARFYVLAGAEKIPEPDVLPATSLEAQLRKNGSLHFGDPPYHVGKFNSDLGCTGVTMNCWDLKVLEFWKRDTHRGWERVAELEVDLPDLVDPERTA